ncbi:MAG: hypothetical protein PHE79_07690 [Eubacteriales bacterium]|nr:hypothetical protein [Eubacteriales bacterium]
MVVGSELAAVLVLAPELEQVVALLAGLEQVAGMALVFVRKDPARVSYNQIFSQGYRSSDHISDCMG